MTRCCLIITNLVSCFYKTTMMCPHLLSAFLHVLWPVSCPVCGRLGEALCAECADSLFLSPPLPRCLRCGGIFPCPRHPDAPRIRSASIYDEKIKSVILALKYGGLRAVGRPLAAACEDAGVSVVGACTAAGTMTGLKTSAAGSDNLPEEKECPPGGTEFWAG